MSIRIKIFISLLAAAAFLVQAPLALRLEAQPEQLHSKLLHEEAAAHAHDEGQEHVHVSHSHETPHQDQAPWSEHSHPVDPCALASCCTAAAIAPLNSAGLDEPSERAARFTMGAQRFVPSERGKDIFHPPA